MRRAHGAVSVFFVFVAKLFCRYVENAAFPFGEIFPRVLRKFFFEFAAIRLYKSFEYPKLGIRTGEESLGVAGGGVLSESRCGFEKFCAASL